MNILLIQPILWPIDMINKLISKEGSDRGFQDPRYYFSLGIMHIGSMARARGHNVKFLDLDRLFFRNLNHNNLSQSLDIFLWEQIDGAMREYGPDVVGISWNFDCNKTLVEKCSKIVKSINPNTIVVFGGHFPTNRYDEIIQSNTDVDYIVLGEGEFVFAELLDDLYAKKEIKSPHIAHHSDRLNKSPAIVEDLGSIPLFYDLIDAVDFEDYVLSRHSSRPIIPRENQLRSVYMMTSRGCPNSCIYCVSHRVHGKKVRLFPLDWVMSHIDEMIEKHNINTIIFEDDHFTFYKDKTIRFCQEVWNRYGSRFYLEFPNGIAIKGLDEELIYWMVKAGMKHINIAIESGNQYVQDTIIKKRVDLKAVKPLVECLKKYGLIVRAYFIIGFPGETLDMMRDTYNFAKYLELDWSVFSFACPVTGSDLEKMARETPDFRIGNADDVSHWYIRLGSKDWSFEDIVKLRDEFNADLNFINNPNFKNQEYQKLIWLFEDILRDYPDHELAKISLKKAKELNDERLKSRL